MKVLLVRPQAPNKLSFTKILDNEPLELEYLHTALQQEGIEDYIYDGLVEFDIEEAIRREKPDVIAITGYITQETLMIGYCRLAKRINPTIVTIVGGVHAQLNYSRFYCDEIDYVYRSECVWDFVKLVSLHQGSARPGEPSLHQDNTRLEQPGPHPEQPSVHPGGIDAKALKEINGLCFRGEKGFVENELRAVDIDSLPIPDRSFFYRHRSSYRYLNLTEVATIKTAFSCPYSCNFCYCTLLSGGRYQARDIELVVEELARIDAQNIQIVDDDFLIDVSRLERFISLVKEKDIRKTYICYTRADFVCNHPELIADLAEIGFHYFLVGLEAVSDEELQGFQKQTDVTMNERCISVINSTSAHCIALMIAPVDADKAYFENLYRWIVKNKVLYVTVSIFTPIPGTPLYEQYKDQITSTDIADWDFLHLVMEPAKLSRREFYREYNKLFLRLYRLAKKTGIYDFMDLSYYKSMLGSYLRRKIRGE